MGDMLGGLNNSLELAQFSGLKSKKVLYSCIKSSLEIHCFSQRVLKWRGICIIEAFDWAVSSRCQKASSGAFWRVSNLTPQRYGPLSLVLLIYLIIFAFFFGALWLEISWLLRPVNDDSIFRCSWQTYCQYQFTILYVIFSPWKIKIKKPSRLFIVMWLATQGELYWYPAGFLFPLLYSQLFRNLTRRRG